MTLHDAHRADDAALLGRVARGDRDALAVLVDELGGAAFALAVRVVRDRALAEDVVQDAFLSVWRRAGSFDSRAGSAATWVLSIVRNAAIDVVRREERRRPRALDGSPAATVDAAEVEVEDLGATDPLAAAWTAARAQQVAGALRDLSPEQRQVIELAYFDGLSQSEIAERLELPVGTVKTRTHRALARLRDLLAADLAPEEHPDAH